MNTVHYNAENNEKQMKIYISRISRLIIYPDDTDKTDSAFQDFLIYPFAVFLYPLVEKGGKMRINTLGNFPVLQQFADYRQFVRIHHLLQRRRSYRRQEFEVLFLQILQALPDLSETFVVKSAALLYAFRVILEKVVLPQFGQPFTGAEIRAPNSNAAARFIGVK